MVVLYFHIITLCIYMLVFRILVERILNTSLVPFSLEPIERMKRLYTLYANLDEHAVK